VIRVSAFPDPADPCYPLSSEDDVKLPLLPPCHSVISAPKTWTLAAIFLLPILAGCPGQLPADFPFGTGGSAPGTGGNSSGSGGNTTGSGGSTGSGGATGSGGGTGSGGSTGSGGATACDAPGTIFKTTCGMAGCHDGLIQVPNLKDTAGVAARLIGQAATLLPCNGQTFYVNPTLPAGGVLLQRVTTSTCTDQMPPQPTYPALTQSQIDCITSWITANVPSQ
jgi:hypothetical protein